MLLINSTKKAFQLTLDLANILNKSLLESKLPNLKSNKVGEQFWCIIGARESYIKAIQNSEWLGFSCSIKNRFSIYEIIEKLENTQQRLEILGKLNIKQEEILLDLYTHEIQHHGQLIRFCYALGIEFPKSWNKAYTV